MVKIIGGKEFTAMTSAEAENNSIFLDSSDNIIKKKDNSGNVSAVGGAVWYIDSNSYDVYDDFESYSTGAFVTNTDWTVVTNGPTAEVVSSTVTGGTGNCLKVICNTALVSKSITITSLTLPAQKSCYAKLAIGYGATGGSGGSTSASISIGLVGATGVISNATANSNPGSYYSTSTSLLVIYKGDDKYDVYIGGKKIATDLVDATPQILISGTTNGFTGEGINVTVYVDDIVMSK